MKRGTKSILFGTHQFLWHPITVLIAWWKLYGRPSWQEVACIFLHDIGYWGCETMDGEDGSRHPYAGADLAGLLLGQRYFNLCLGHSRHLAKKLGIKPSKLCYADKLSIKYDPWWFYLPRAWLSGELGEYRLQASAAGFWTLENNHRSWFKWVRGHLTKVAEAQDGAGAAYMGEQP